MCLVIATRRMSFRDEKGEHIVYEREGAQIIPDRFLKDPYFKAAELSGWITQVPVEEPEVQKPDPGKSNRKKG